MDIYGARSKRSRKLKESVGHGFMCHIGTKRLGFDDTYAYKHTYLYLSTNIHKHTDTYIDVFMGTTSPIQILVPVCFMFICSIVLDIS